MNDSSCTVGSSPSSSAAKASQHKAADTKIPGISDPLLSPCKQQSDHGDPIAELTCRLKLAETLAARHQRELSAFMRSAGEVLQQRGFAETARAIFDYCCELTGATSGYVALLNEDGSENEVLFLESGGAPCSVDPYLPMPIRGLRADAYRLNKAVYDNNFMQSEWVKFMPAGHMTLRNVMFAPLVIDGRTEGIMGMANKPEDFTENDAFMAGGFGELAAIALRNSRYLDERKAAAIEREELIEELQGALRTVKRLSGLLPICSHCKKIRDDKGFWSQVENYICEHSDAEMSHSICPDCADQYYPDLDIYGEDDMDC